MSAFMCSCCHIMQVVNLLADFDQWCGCVGEDTEDKRTRLGRRLQQMNKNSIRARYGETPDVQLFRYFTPYVRRNNMSRIAQAKLLYSLRYQCSEGRVPETKLYKDVSRACDLIDNWFIRGETQRTPQGGVVRLSLRDLPEWSNAEWSI